MVWKKCTICSNSFEVPSSLSSMDVCRQCGEVGTDAGKISSGDDAIEKWKDSNTFTQSSSREDKNLGLALTFSNLNPTIFKLTLSLIFINFILLWVVEFEPFWIIVFTVIAVLATIIFHGASAVIIKILDNLKEINKKLDKD